MLGSIKAVRVIPDGADVPPVDTVPSKPGLLINPNDVAKLPVPDPVTAPVSVIV